MVPLAEDAGGNPLSLGRKRRTVSAALRRALQVRDGCCQFPGCTHHRFTDAHHIEHWVNGGETSLDNTLLLCRRHHRFVHEYGFSVERDEGGVVTFHDPRGRVVPETGERGLRQIAHRERTRRLLAEAGVTIDETTNAPRWDGTPVDYALCVDALSHADHLDAGWG